MLALTDLRDIHGHGTRSVSEPPYSGNIRDLGDVVEASEKTKRFYGLPPLPICTIL